MDNKLIWVGGALLAFYLFNQQRNGGGPTCPKFYLINDTKVCETELLELGYIKWNDRATGPSGWYAIDSFVNAFNFPPATFIQAIQSGATNSQNTTNTALFDIGQELLNLYIKDGETPLLAA